MVFPKYSLWQEPHANVTYCKRWARFNIITFRPLMVFEKILRLIGRSNIIVVHCNQNNVGHVLAEVGGLLESEY